MKKRTATIWIRREHFRDVTVPYDLNVVGFDINLCAYSMPNHPVNGNFLLQRKLLSNVKLFVKISNTFKRIDTTQINLNSLNLDYMRHCSMHCTFITGLRLPHFIFNVKYTSFLQPFLQIMIIKVRIYQLSDLHLGILAEKRKMFWYNDSMVLLDVSGLTGKQKGMVLSNIF